MRRRAQPRVPRRGERSSALLLEGPDGDGLGGVPRDVCAVLDGRGELEPELLPLAQGGGRFAGDLQDHGLALARLDAEALRTELQPLRLPAGGDLARGV